jgi:hypothetical protein
MGLGRNSQPLGFASHLFQTTKHKPLQRSATFHPADNANADAAQKDSARSRHDRIALAERPER